MTWQTIVAIIALIVSGAAAWYARRAVHEAQESNRLSRLNALLALRTHYLELVDDNGRLAQALHGMVGGQMAEGAVANLNTKVRDVTREIDKYHNDLVGRCT